MRDMSPAAVHKRLVFPPNAVFDLGIDLKRKPAPQPTLVISTLTPRARRLAAAAAEKPVRRKPVKPYIVPRQYPSAADLTRVVCEHFLVMPIDLVSQRRDMKSVRARQVWAYLARDLTPFSLPMIGRLLGHRDHTTILHSCRKIEDMVKAQPGFGLQVFAARHAVVALFTERQDNACFDPREI